MPDIIEPTAEAVEFFYERAGFSYDPDVETEDEGRRRCAVQYAEAEARPTICTADSPPSWAPGVTPRASTGGRSTKARTPGVTVGRLTPGDYP